MSQILRNVHVNLAHSLASEIADYLDEVRTEGIELNVKELTALEELLRENLRSVAFYETALHSLDP